MERALYPDSVEVDHSHLAYTESTKIDQILDRTLAVAQTGIISGLTTTVNTVDNTLIDVLFGEAFAPNGERVALTVTQAGLALASSTVGTLNYVLLSYGENETQPEPHENGTSILNTLVVAFGTLSILTEAQYNALLTIDRERAAVVARVTATGGALQSTSILQPGPYTAVLAPTQPVIITGVSITSIDFSTQAGSGLLDFDASPANGADPLVPAPRLRWTAPGEGSPGVYVSISANGSYALLSSSLRSLTVSIIAVNLPLIDQTETIRVDSLYALLVPRFTAADYLHRTYLGSGAPSTRNPHGLTFEDLGGSPTGQVEEHQLFMHSNGIRRGSNAIFLSSAVVPVFGPSPDFVTVTGPIAGDAYTVNGKVLFSIAETQITFLTSVSTSISLYNITVNEGGHLARSLRLEHPLAPTVTGVAIIDIDDSFAAGSYNLVYNRLLKTLRFNSGPITLIRGDGNYTLYDSIGRKVVVNVGSITNLGYSTLPAVGGPTFTDAIAVQSIVDRKLNFLIASVTWDGSNSLGWTETLIDPKVTTEKRLFGTLGLNEIRDDVLSHDVTQFSATYTVGDGRVTFGDFDGATGIQTAIDALASLGVPGSIFVKPGTYDPFILNADDIAVQGSTGAIIDGVSTVLTPGACVTVTANRCALSGLQLNNAVLGVSQVSGDDNRGVGLIFGSGLTTNLGYTAGSRNSYTGNKRNVRTITISGSMTPLDDIALVDATAGDVTLTMPLGSAGLNKIKIKKIDTTTNAVIIQPSGGDDIDYMAEVQIDVYLDSEYFEPITGGWVT